MRPQPLQGLNFFEVNRAAPGFALLFINNAVSAVLRQLFCVIQAQQFSAAYQLPFKNANEVLAN